MTKYKPLFETDKLINAEKCKPIAEFLKKYHNYSIQGLEKLSMDQNYIFVLSHSLATYEIFLFGSYLYLEYGVWCRPVIHDLLMHLPLIKNICAPLAPIDNKFSVIKTALKNKDSIVIMPGGMEEALRSSEDKYKICWDKRKGFVKLALETGTPIILAACPKADDLFDVKKSKLTELILKKWELPLPFFKGKSLFLPFIPKKIQLTHYISGPYYPPKFQKGQDQIHQIDNFHKYLIMEMENLMSSSIK